MNFFIKDNFEKRTYYKDNLYSTNNLLSLILAISSLVGIIFAICSALEFFNINFFYSGFTTLIALIFSLTQFILNKTPKLRRITKYTGLIFLILMVSFICATPGVGLSIFISFAIIPFVSTLYLSKKTTIITSTTCYFALLLSLYLKAHNYNLIPHDEESIYIWFSTEAIGYSMNYFFVFLFALIISKSFKSTLNREYEKQHQLHKIKRDLIQSFANIIEWSDKYTGEHIKRTCIYVELISNKLVEKNYYTDILDSKTINLYSSAAALHDIGKINVPNNILSKPGKFTPEEYEIMKTHSQIGYDIISKDLYTLEDPEYIKIAGEMALYHHEKWDGTGYPKNISGTQIPLCSRIMAAADVLDALLSKRQYKESYSIEKTFEIFNSEKGKQFEPCIADAVISLKDKILEVTRN